MDNTNGFTRRTPKYVNGDHGALLTAYDRHEPLAKRGDPCILGTIAPDRTIAPDKGDTRCERIEIL